LRLRWLLVGSFQIVTFCFLPIVLTSASVATEKTWALSSGARLVCFITVTAFDVRETRRLVKLEGQQIESRFTALLASISLGMVVLNVLNVVFIQEAWPYLAGLVVMLTIPFLMFLRLLRGILRPSGAA